MHGLNVILKDNSYTKKIKNLQNEAHLKKRMTYWNVKESVHL